MELANEPGKLNFLIQVHSPYSRLITGGIVAMHKLAYKIAERGHYAYTFCKPEYPHPNIRQIQSEIVKQDGFIEFFTWENFNYVYNNTIVVYPQITGGNPFGVKNVARWIMYDTEKVIEDSYGPDEVLFNFGKFKTYKGIPEKQLTVFDYKLDTFMHNNTGKRKGLCYIKHKQTPKDGHILINKLGAVNITNWRENGGFEYLQDQLNKFEYLLIYDQKSFYTVAAGLCGCKTIILNPGPSYEFTDNAHSDSEDYNDVLTPLEYRLVNPIQMYGVAYGWNDIQWANNTIHMVRDHILAMEEIDNKTVDKFINFWQNKLQ